MRMTRNLLLVVVVATTLALGSASAAAAGSWFNPTNWNGFIARGDVIANIGQDALVTSDPATYRPLVVWSGSRDDTITCTYSDGSTQTLPPYRTGMEVEMVPTSRLSPGTGTITGYILPGTVVDANFFPPVSFEYDLCWNARPSDDLAVVRTSGSFGPWYDAQLWFYSNSLYGQIPYTLVQ